MAQGTLEYYLKRDGGKEIAPIAEKDTSSDGSLFWWMLTEFTQSKYSYLTLLFDIRKCMRNPEWFYLVGERDNCYVFEIALDYRIYTVVNEADRWLSRRADPHRELFNIIFEYWPQLLDFFVVQRDGNMRTVLIFKKQI